MIHRPEIVFRAIDHSDAIESAIRDRIDKLAERHPSIATCTVTVDSPHRHSHKGQLYSISIDLTVPGAELVVSRDPQKNHAHEDVYVAMRDAFDAAERRVSKHLSKARRYPRPEREPELGFGNVADADDIADG